MHEIPPNGQGIAALMALGILENFDLGVDAARQPRRAAPADRGDEARLRRRLPLRERSAHDDASRPTRCSTAPTSRARAKLIDPKRAQDFGPGEPPRGGTVYLCAADEDGMMVSLIQSNYMGFGSGVVVPGTGISLQNRGAGFSLDAGHPERRRAAASGRTTRSFPASSRSDGAPLAAFGVMGGPMQPQGHVQTLVRLVDYGMNPQAVLDAPRWKVAPNGAVDLEASASPELRAALVAMGHVIADQPDSYMDFGAGQYIVKARRLRRGVGPAGTGRRRGSPGPGSATGRAGRGVLAVHCLIVRAQDLRAAVGVGVGK